MGKDEKTKPEQAYLDQTKPEQGLLKQMSAAEAAGRTFRPEATVSEKPDGNEDRWIFICTADCTKGLRPAKGIVVKQPDGSVVLEAIKSVRVVMRFENSEFILTERKAKAQGLPTDPTMTGAAEFIMLAKQFPGYGTEFLLVEGPGVRQTKEMSRFRGISKAKSEISKRTPHVVSGSR